MGKKSTRDVSLQLNPKTPYQLRNQMKRDQDKKRCYRVKVLVGK